MIEERRSARSVSRPPVGGGTTMSEAIWSFSTASISTARPRTVELLAGLRKPCRPRAARTRRPCRRPVARRRRSTTRRARSRRNRSRQPHAAVGEPQRQQARPLNSSATLPSSSPSTSSSVIRPATGPPRRQRAPDGCAARAESRAGDRPAWCRALEDRPDAAPASDPARPDATKSVTDIFRVQDADDVVERAAEDRKAAVRARRDDPHHVGHRRRERRAQPGVPAAPSADGRCAGRAERAMQPDLLLRLEQAAVAALGDEERDLLGRMHVTMTRARERGAHAG